MEIVRGEERERWRRGMGRVGMKGRKNKVGRLKEKERSAGGAKRKKRLMGERKWAGRGEGGEKNLRKT